MLRFGILGFGGAGQAHLFYLSCVAGCRVTKIYDPSAEALERAASAAPSVVRTRTLEGFWNDLDVVVICTPDATHANYIVEALAHGVHVLCEKPLADSLDGVRRIRSAAAASDRTVAVVHQMRFVPLHQQVERQIRAGALGRLAYLEGYYAHNLGSRAFVNDSWRRD